VLTAAGATGIFFVAGCSFQEAICSSGEYPVAAVRDTGRACVRKGQAPPAGWVRFPQGKVPAHVGDRWDRYWKVHMLDENRHEVSE
jgi:hypothetical protein